MKRRAFTLLELLVVISIIGILVAIGLPALMAAKKASKEKACRASISNIETALGSYEAKFGDYPPSGDFVKGANTLNQGGESLVWHLFSTTKGGPYLDMSTWESKLGNSDADDAGKKPDNSVYQLSEMKELEDEWKNPFIYFHWRDYAKPARFSHYMIHAEEQDCVPAKSSKSGAYHGPGKFQLWSAGSDDKNNNGEEGDIAPWD